MMPEVSALSNLSEQTLEIKEEGNKLFKECDYQASLSKYLKALKLSEQCNPQDRVDKVSIYKNLAAVYLKLNNYEEAVKNATAAIELSPGDVKALFRRCQAYENLENFNGAFKDAVAIQRLEPTNSLIAPILSRLSAKVQDIAKANASTSNRISKMLECLSNPHEEKKLQAANNLLVLARENAGANMIIEQQGLDLLKKFFSVEKSIDLKLACVRVLSEVSKNNFERAKKVLHVLPINFIVTLLHENYNEEYVTAIQYLIQTLLSTFSGYDVKEGREADKELIKEHEEVIDELMLTLLKHSSSRLVSGLGRDALLEVIMKNVQWEVLNWGAKLIENDGLTNLLDIASELEEIKYESSMDITSSTRTHVAVTLEQVYCCMDHDKAKETYRERVMAYIKEKLKGEDIESKVRATACIISLLHGPLDVGNHCLGQQGIVEMMLVMAGSEDEVQQRIAAEALIAAASKKDKCTSIASMGAGILKKLYKSSNDKIRVRALVGLCKFGSVGGTDYSVRPFAEGSNQALSQACRKFLINPSKDKDLRKWAAEGLAYLTLDADIKEDLIQDQTALLALIELGRTGDLSALYGVITTLVNLTNSYDKQEVMPELVELAKFAKQHVPEDHPKDNKEFITRRCKILSEAGVTSALVSLSKSESKTSRELMCRVFNAICEYSDLRGAIVQQGGAKILLKMALENNTDKGKIIAGQALARIGITINPEVAFPGQRAVEVVRPISALLHQDCSGLENFEALMALTNLAQVSDSVRNRVIKDGGYSKIENYMYEDHELIKRAAVQCLVNLLPHEYIIHMYEGENDRVKYLVVLCEEDDLDTAKAAAAALAILTSVSKVACRKIFNAKRWFEVLLQLVSSSDKELQHRGVYIVHNIINHDEEGAKQIVETNIFEVLMAIIRPEVDDIEARVKELAKDALKKAEEKKLIQPFDESKLEDSD